MLSTLDINSVKTFLLICKKEIRKGNCYFVQRNININGNIINSKQALLNIGILKISEVWAHILDLKINDCVKVDFDYDFKRDTNSEIYVFKKLINNHLVYIKLTLRPSGIICISFHESY